MESGRASSACSTSRHTHTATSTHHEWKRKRVDKESWESAPQFLRPLSSVTLSPDAGLSLTVELEAGPSPATFAWFLDGAPVLEADTRGFSVHSRPFASTLTARKVTAGQYMVVARNASGTAASQAGVRLPSSLHASSRATSIDSQPAYQEEHYHDEIDSLSGLEQRPPKIIKGIRSYRVRPSDKITLFMEIDSTHPVIFRWFYEDVEIPPGASGPYLVRASRDMTALTIDGPREGIYKVSATNSDGRCTSYGYVTVRDYEEEDAMITSSYKIVQEDSIHQDFHQQATSALRGRSSALPYAPRFVHEVPTLTIRDGEEVTIDVEVDAVPKASFTWFCSGFELRLIPGKLEISTKYGNRSRLRILGPKEGEYRCVASNSSGTAVSAGRIIHEITSVAPPGLHLSSVSRLSVQSETRSLGSESHHSHSASPAPLLPPRLIHGIGSFQVTHRDKVTITIQVDSRSPVRFQWTVGEAAVPEGRFGRYEVTSSSCVSSLTVDGLEEGLVKVTATNRDGTATSYGYVKVLEESKTETVLVLESEEWYSEEWEERIRVGPEPRAPIFTHGLPSLNRQEGQSLTLTVQVSSEPESELCWFFNGFELRASDRCRITRMGANRSRLELWEALEGEYRVTATNSVGSASTLGFVRVESMPRHPRLLMEPSPKEWGLRLPTPKPLPPPPARLETAAPVFTRPVPPVFSLRKREPLKLDVVVSGYPAADFNWSFNGRPLLTSERMRMLTAEQNRY